MLKTILIIIGYICGSIPTGLIIGKYFFNIDIREHGSKNIGGTNATRVLGKKAGFIVSVIDILKVFIPCILTRYFYGVDFASVVGIAGMIGHCYSVFLKFKGGKAVAAYLGVLFALNFPLGIIMTLVWKILKHLTNYVSVASIVASFIASFCILYLNGAGYAFYSLLVGSFIILYRHKSNIQRLYNGTENKVKSNL